MPEVYINGTVYDAGSCTCRINGKIYTGFLGVKYDEKRERKKVIGQGRGRRPIGVTKGLPTAEDGALTLTKEAAQALREDLSIVGLGSYGDAIFTVTISVFELGKVPILDELINCWIAGGSSGYETESVDPLKEEIPIGMTEVRRNGLSLWSVV